jgi:hypothetical protein
MNRGAPEERRVAGWILYLGGTPRRGVEFHAPLWNTWLLNLVKGNEPRGYWIDGSHAG